MISTCNLLLNAGHEATVHSLGNALKTLLQAGLSGQTPITDALIEETLRFDPPPHLFRRWAYEDVEVMGRTLPKGTQIACLRGAANRCAKRCDAPANFDPARSAKANLAIGAGLHFCLGTTLARLELRHALRALVSRLPGLKLAQTPHYADIYHFHGLKSLFVSSK
jgi:unspecific monooxygenase